jgi:Flp pilus assembly pilin Flp
MVDMITAIGRLVRRDDGQDLMEYGLLVALIAIVAIVVVGTVGNTVNTTFWETFNSVIASAA